MPHLPTTSIRPIGPGMDAAGIVHEIGPDTTTDLQVGDRAMAMVVPIDASGGAYAEYVVLQADQVAPAPQGTATSRRRRCR